MADTKYTVQDLQDNLDYLAETKDKIKSAIIEKGQPITDNDTFRSYADKIKDISTGIDTSDATATADDILSPKTAYVGDGVKIAGTIQSVYEKTNPRLVETNLNVDKTSSELPAFCATFDGENLITFDNSKNFILKNKYGTTLDTKNITDYGGTTSETIYKLASSKVADADGNVYVCAITKNSKNVYFYIFKIDYTTKKLSTNYYRNATSSVYLDCGMNVCFANRRADVLVMFSDARNNDSYTAKITQVNSDLSVTTLSSYTNNNLYWISSVSFNENDSLLTYNLAHGQDAGNGFIMQLKNYVFTNVRLSAWRTTYTLINTHYLLRRNSNGAKELCTYKVTDSAINVTKISNVGVIGLNGERSFDNIDVQPLFNNYFVIYYNATKYLYHLNEDDSTISLVSSNKVDYLYASYNQIFYTIGSTRYLQTVSTDDKLTGFSRNGENFMNLSDSDITAENIIKDKVAYGKDGKLIGTMPNNGTLTYTPTEKSQTIPAGYTSGGKVNPMDATTSTVYKQAIAILKDIKPTASAIYKQIDYIGGTGSQRLYTDIQTDSATDTYEITLRDTNISNWEYYFHLGMMTLARYETRSTEFCFWAGTNRVSESFKLGNINDGNWHTIKITPDALSFDGSRKISYSRGGTSTGVIYIFYPGDTTSSFLVKEFKMYRAGELISHLIPYKNIQTNIVGMYDLIGNKFYNNTGSGTFTSGNTIGDIDVEDYTLKQRLLDLQDYINQNIVPANIRADKTIFDVTGTAPVTFSTIEEMNEHTNLVEDTFAIVYGTSYIGTYRLNNGAWTQIGNSTEK